MRNLAIEASSTIYIMSADVDFLPRANLAVRFAASLPRILAIDMQRPTAFVVPAFEVDENVTTAELDAALTSPYALRDLIATNQSRVFRSALVLI